MTKSHEVTLVIRNPDDGKETEFKIRTREGAVVGWEGITEKGEPLPFTPQNLSRVMSIPFIFDQIYEQILREKLF